VARRDWKGAGGCGARVGGRANGGGAGDGDVEGVSGGSGDSSGKGDELQGRSREGFVGGVS
jgi:hypothetical protein